MQVSQTLLTLTLHQYLGIFCVGDLDFPLALHRSRITMMLGPYASVNVRLLYTFSMLGLTCQSCPIEAYSCPIEAYSCPSEAYSCPSEAYTCPSEATRALVRPIHALVRHIHALNEILHSPMI